MANALKKSSEENILTTQTNKSIPQSTKPDVLPVESELICEMITTLAYYKAEQRGFEPGHELEDWLEAERELLNNPPLLRKGLD